MPARPLLERCAPLSGWGLSTYDKCEFRCVYCITGVQGVSEPRYPPERVVAQLRSELDTIGSIDRIGIGLFCDAYPPPEDRYGVTRRVVTELVERALTFQIITKGLGVRRDVDLVSHRSNVHVIVSLCTTDEENLRRVDPRAPTARDRLDLLHELAARGVQVELGASPWTPGITDTDALIAAVDPSIPVRFTPLRVLPPAVASSPWGRRWDQRSINEAFEREFERVGERRNVFWSPRAPLDGSAPHVSLLCSRPGREQRVRRVPVVPA